MKIEHDNTRVVLQHRQESATLSAEFVEERVSGLLSLELDNLWARNVSGFVGGECFGEPDVDPSLTWKTVV